MKKLFIIGNGFDIQHGIKSRYQDFHDYLRELYMNEHLKNKSFDDFSPWRYYIPRPRNILGHFDDDQIVDVLGFLDYCLTKSQNGAELYNYYVNSEWWSIESILAKIDLREFFCELDEYPDDDYPDEYKVYDIAECFKYLNGVVSMWAKNIDIKTIKPIRDFEKLFDCENDLFFNFNYTKTLEEVYGAQQVLHVHGQSGQYVLFGHEVVENVTVYCENNNIPKCCEHAVKVFLETTQKDTAKRSKGLATYYLFLDRDITEIYTYGFSFSEVDLVYIRDICATLDTTKITWFLSDFDSEQKIEEFKKLIIKCGFKGVFDTFGVGCSSKKSNDENKGYLRYLEEQRKYLGKANFELRQFILDYYTIGYQRPEGYKHSSSSFLMIPRLIKILFIIVLERVQDFFKQKNQTKEKNLNRRQ